MKRALVLLAFAAATAAWADIPRPEHPKPQFQRTDWVNLNGDMWTYEFDFREDGLERKLNESKGFARKITVPFCPESPLSGVGYTDFIRGMWYHRKLGIPAAWTGKRILLHFGGIDYESEIFIDGKPVGFHFGGTVSFTVDLTTYVTAGNVHDLVVRVSDHTEGDSHQPRGKQRPVNDPNRRRWQCHYSRTTGIWQTVWLEAMDKAGLKDVHTVADLDGGRFVFTPEYHADRVPAPTFRVTVRRPDGKLAGRAEVRAAQAVPAVVVLGEPHPWSPEDPFLYDVLFEVVGGKGEVIDRVRSYAGLRKVAIQDGKIYLNNEPIFLRFVLHQGFWPDGVWTAPTDAALKRDIELAQSCGLNGARLHQRVFEERFHYWADRLGFLTWGESADSGIDAMGDLAGARNFISEWREIVQRDRNHPSIIAWTPFNETRKENDKNLPHGPFMQHQRLQNDCYDICKALDPTRPVNSASGELHSKTDLWTVHNYAPPERLVRLDVPAGRIWSMKPEWTDLVYHRYTGQPYLIDEFGGLGWWRDDDGREDTKYAWGFFGRYTDEEKYFRTLKGDVDIFLNSHHISGFCYTQFTDIDQERNGLFYFDRTPKFDPARYKAIFGAPVKGFPFKQRSESK